MKLSIEAMRGTWRCQNESRTYFDDTLEGLLVQLAPDAPEEYLWHTAEVLGAILGAEVVEIPQMSEPDFKALADAVFGAQDDPEHWEPTEAQQAYFEAERTEEVDEFNPDEAPRGV